jgi:YhcH/YjgK/YiaL family protein
MILSTLSNADRYASLHPLFPRAFDYIRNTDLHALAPGHYPIISEDLFVIVEHMPGRTRAEAQLECHRKFIDIQLVLQGVDEMGWKPLADCHNPVSDYSAEKDIRFFRDEPDSWIARRILHLLSGGCARAAGQHWQHPQGGVQDRAEGWVRQRLCLSDFHRSSSGLNYWPRLERHPHTNISAFIHLRVGPVIQVEFDITVTDVGGRI